MHFFNQIIPGKAMASVAAACLLYQHLPRKTSSQSHSCPLAFQLHPGVCPGPQRLTLMQTQAQTTARRKHRHTKVNYNKGCLASFHPLSDTARFKTHHCRLVKGLERNHKARRTKPGYLDCASQLPILSLLLLLFLEGQLALSTYHVLFQGFGWRRGCCIDDACIAYDRSKDLWRWGLLV